MNNLRFIFFVFCPLASLAQPTIGQVIAQVNSRILSVRQGYFESSYRWKSMFKKDTTSNKGRVYFFREHGDLDSICQFIIPLGGKMWVAYDGMTFYKVDEETRSIRARFVKKKGDLSRYLNGGPQGHFAFDRYLYHFGKKPFDPLGFERGVLEKEGQSVKITIRDSFPNPLKSIASDPDYSHYKTVYCFSFPELVLQKKQEMVQTGELVQYLENKLSPIVPLPDSVTFQHVFKLDSLRAAGYEIRDKTPPPPSGQTPLVAIGNTLDAIGLPDLDGNQTPVFDSSRNLVFLDFWYRACAPCIKAMPSVEVLHQKYRDKGLKVWGINPTDKDPAEIKDFLQKREVGYSSLMDHDKVFTKQLGITGFPTVVLVDAKTRKVLYVGVGADPDMEKTVSRLIDRN
jgi:thiol-disulfide isomerase/thioredoxin